MKSIQPSQVKKRPCLKTKEEFQLLRRIHRMCMEQNIIESLGGWDDEVQATRWQKHYEQWGHTLQFLEWQGEIIGTINVHPKDWIENGISEKKLFLEQLYILQAYQGCGLGSFLLSGYADQDLHFSVLLRDQKAAQFYEKHGYQIVRMDEYQSFFKKRDERPLQEKSSLPLRSPSLK